ncbi:hypothetical protein SNE40_023064 [Patella caerulea]|uniref:Uncharacterized protein n=1 Tax=Patella caerulea TaxID=87958 RepID=A0AAN8G5I8_PATCE
MPVTRPKGKSGKKEQNEVRDILSGKKETQKIKIAEKNRRKDFHRKQKAASIIQRSWRRYKRQKFEMLSAVKKSVILKRSQNTEEEWEEQIAALTIQLAWRKYYRRKLLKALQPNRKLLRSWDPDVIAAKQQALVHQIYYRQHEAPFWHPILKKAIRPLWSSCIPSPAAVSYNFAVDQYHPLAQVTYTTSIAGSGSIEYVE